ncbi:MAG: hypothetical protein LDL39_15965 [Magnetospirillum sp.]|nr:hypothetical protein [Magnetospirillum sp.]
MRKLAFAGMVILTALTIQPGQARAAEETANAWPRALPPGVRPPLDLVTLSGYWARQDGGNEDFLYISPQGLLDATIWKSGNVSAFIGRWKPVQEIAFNAPAERRETLMVSDEKYCSTDRTSEDHRFFRLLDTNKPEGGMVIQIDYAISLSPPPNPLAVDNEALWSLFRENAKKTNYKDEGSRVRIDEADVPLWFRNLVAQTILVGHWGCDWR